MRRARETALEDGGSDLWTATGGTSSWEAKQSQPLKQWWRTEFWRSQNWQLLLLMVGFRSQMELDQIHGGERVIREAWREAAGTHQMPLCLVISTLTRFLPLCFSQVLLASSTRNSARRTLWKASCKLNQSVAGRIQHRVQENQKSCSGEAHTRQIQWERNLNWRNGKK